MYSACNIHFLYYYFERFVSIWKLEWRERRFNFERDVREIQSDKEPKPTEHILEIWILGRGESFLFTGEKKLILCMIYFGWRGVIVPEKVGPSWDVCLCSASAWADADSLVKWWKWDGNNGHNSRTHHTPHTTHSTQALTRPGITRG